MIKEDPLYPILKRLAASPSDEAAWKSLYLELWPFVVAVLYRRFKNRSVSEDCAQDVFIRVLRSRPFERIHDPNAFRAYIWKMAANVANTYLQRMRHIEGGEQAFGELEGDRTSVMSDSYDRLLAQEAVGMARKVLGSDDAKLLQLLLEGRGVADVADELGLTYSNAGVRFHRLRQRLRKLLEIQEKKSFQPTVKKSAFERS